MASPKPSMFILPGDAITGGMVTSQVLPGTETANLAGLNGFEEQNDNSAIVALKNLLERKVDVTPSQEECLKPLFNQYRLEAGNWDHYFTTGNVSQREMTKLELSGYFQAFAQADERVFTGNFAQSCLTTCIHSWFLSAFLKLLADVGKLHSADGKISSNKNWPFAMLCQIKSPGNVLVDLPYTCRSDLRFDCVGFPMIICEVDSGTNRDEKRLQLQTGYLAKVAHHCCSSRSICSMGIFFSSDGAANIYYMTSDGKKVYYSRQCIYVDKMFGIFEILFLTFNFIHYITEIRGTLLKDDFRTRLKEISTSTRKRGQDSQGSRGPKQGPNRSASAQPRGQTSSAPPRMVQRVAHLVNPMSGDSDDRLALQGDSRAGCLPNEALEEEEEEVLWSDGSPNTDSPQEGDISYRDNDQEMIQAQGMVELLVELVSRGIQMSSGDSVLQLPSHVVTGQTRKGEVVAIKFTTNRREVDIHIMLKKNTTPSPYIILLLDYAGPVSGCYLLVTHFCTPLPELDNVVVADYAVILMSHLLMGMEFLHKNCIAHLDVRPDNLVVDFEGQQPCLKVIDFGLSVYVKDSATPLYGFRGFPPWVSPEVRSGGAFLPFAADAWACGLVLSQYQDHCTGEKGKWLIELSKELTTSEELKRMSVMEDAMKTLYFL